ncbi:MAG: carboxymuconolactone decarboxylase family protein [Candidatus Omnitrophota bacterium]
MTEPWYLKQSELGRAFQHFYVTCKEKTFLDKKTAELMKLALACVLRCPHCTENHIKASMVAGATKQEVAEALLIAAVEGAGSQLYWQKEVFEKYFNEADQEGKNGQGCRDH